MELFFVLLIPLILAAVAVTGMAKGVDVYDGLSTGALEGLRILVRILPPLNMTMEDAQEAIRRFEKACDAACEKIKAAG